MTFDLAATIRDIPDFPAPGIVFKDITTLLKDKKAFRKAVERLVDALKGRKVDAVVAVEARGFIFGAAVAYALGCAFVPVRKPRKLPAPAYSVSYELEYGTDSIAIHQDALRPGDHVVIVDDLLATGGTVAAVVELLKKFERVHLEAIAVLIELTFLHGRSKLKGQDVISILAFDGK